MIKPSLITIFTIGIIAMSPFRAGGQNGGNATEQEKDVQQASIKLAREAIAEGDKANKEKHYDLAAGYYQYACDHLHETPLTHALRADAIAAFSEASVRLAEQRIADGRFEDAKKAAMLVLDPKYDPTYKPAIELLAHLEGPESVPPRKDSGPLIAIANTGSDASKTESVRIKLEHIIIPQINFKDVTVRDAIEFLRRKSIELDTFETDPAKRGVNIVLKLNVTPALGILPPAAAVPGIPGVPAAPEGPVFSPGDKLITLSLTNIPLSEALRYVCELAGLKMKVEPDGAIIIPLSHEGGFMTKEYTVPPGFLQSTGEDAKTARELLEKAGVVFPDGSDVKYNPDDNKLVVRDTEENINQVDQIVEAATPPPKAELEQAAKAAAAAIHKTETIRNKLARIVIPKIDFHNATVRDAVGFLLKESVALDTAETNPAREGVNIIMKVDFPSGADSIPKNAGDTANPVPGIPAAPIVIPGLRVVYPADAKITLVVKNIPLSEALRYVTELAGLKYIVNPSGVSIVPVSEPTDSLPTKEYYVPPDFLQSTGVGAQTAQELLESVGVQFPIGTSVRYLPAFNKLVVRETEEELDLIDQIVEAATPYSKADLQEADRIVATTARNAKSLRDKLKRIIIPKIEFHEATLSDVLFDLMKTLPELDTAEAKPARRGINFVWTPNSDARISLSLANVSLGDLLHQIASQAGMGVRVDPYAIVIATPLPGFADWLITKQYKVPAGFPNGAGRGVPAGGPLSKPDPQKPMTAIEYLKLCGVQFPQGAGAILISRSGMLFVHETGDEMDLVDQIVAAYINEQSAAAEPSLTPSAAHVEEKAGK